MSNSASEFKILMIITIVKILLVLILIQHPINFSYLLNIVMSYGIMGFDIPYPSVPYFKEASISKEAGRTFAALLIILPIQ